MQCTMKTTEEVSIWLPWEFRPVRLLEHFQPDIAVLISVTRAMRWIRL